MAQKVSKMAQTQMHESKKKILEYGQPLNVLDIATPILGEKILPQKKVIIIDIEELLYNGWIFMQG